MEEKRMSPRFEVPVEIKYYSADNKDKQVDYTVASNISLSGISMPARSSIAKPDSLIKLEIFKKEGNVIPATGRVRWTRAINRNSIMDEYAGIEFVDILSSDIGALISGLSRKRA